MDRTSTPSYLAFASEVNQPLTSISGSILLLRWVFRSWNFPVDVFQQQQDVSMMYVFSTQLLSKASRLRQLSLHGCKLESNFKGQLHSLRVINLGCVVLTQYGLNVEELRLSRCKCPASLSIDGSNLQLKYLLLEYLYGPQKVVLTATKLTTFEYFNVQPIELKFVRVPNLETVNLGVPYNQGTYYVFDDLSRHAPRLQCLSVAGPVILEQRVPSCPISFSKLVKLDFYLNQSYDLHSVVFLLRTCPLVQHLAIMMQGYLAREDATTMAQLQRNIHGRLEVVEFGGFHGSETQIELVIYLLQSAVNLKRMAISSESRSMGLMDLPDQWLRRVSFDNKNKRKLVIERLLGKAASKNAKVILESVLISI